MPELPEISAYQHALATRVTGEELIAVRVRTPSLLRSFDPPLSATHGKTVREVRRLGKRIVLGLDDALFIVVHLMITGRFQWGGAGAPVPRKSGHAAFDFHTGTLLLTEQGSHKRASLHVVRGEAALKSMDPGGVEPLVASLEEFQRALLRENRTLKRALTDPRILSGIGNAHSDEILLRARLSPILWTSRLADEEVERLYHTTRSSLREWVDRLAAEFGDTFPKKITAFHPAMAAHGKFGHPCPQCGTPIQRIRYADRETNYCPDCQTGGKLLADRALSRLLGKDWPRTLEELETHIVTRGGG